MRNDTKKNIWFLAILLPLMLPGGIILFIKKCDPEERYIGAPQPVRMVSPFMDPMPIGPNMRHVAPPLTLSMIKAELSSRGVDPRSMLTDSLGLPLMSQNRLFQLASVSSSDSALRLHLLIWSDLAPAIADRYNIAITPGSAPTPPTPATTPATTSAIPLDPTRVQVEAIMLDRIIWREIQDSGLVRPPQALTWITVDFPPLPPLPPLSPIAPTTLRLKFGSSEDQLPLPQSLSTAPASIPTTAPAVR